MRIERFDRYQQSHLEGAAAVWNAASGPDLSISPAFVRYNLSQDEGEEHDGMIALERDNIAGFVLVKYRGQSPGMGEAGVGWVDAIAVHPDFQRRGYGTALLTWAESWMKQRGVRKVKLGGSLRPFCPSLPEELGSLPFFECCGWAWDGSETWDLARDLGDRKPIVLRPMPECMPGDGIRPAEPGDAAALTAFFKRAFPGRWENAAISFFRNGGKIEDFIILRIAGRIEGFAWLTFPDSARAINRMYPHRLPKPWGHLGPMGVSTQFRDLGWGGLLLQSGLMALRARGIRGCVIDWTNHLDFYGRWGIKPYRRYLFVTKTLE